MGSVTRKWSFKGNGDLNTDPKVTVKGILTCLTESVDKEDQRLIVTLSHGDPAVYSCFRICQTAEVAVVDALQSAKFNCYCPYLGVPSARRAIAAYLSQDLPYQISPDDVYVTLGCGQAIEVLLTVLASPGANILLPRPGFPNYEARCMFSCLEVRHYNLLPEKDWEVDLDTVEALADENTAAIVIINPGNPCGNVFSFEHLKKIAETASKLGIMVIADEIFGHITFGSKQFVPMGVFGSIVPVITLGSISKEWAVTGWRLGWLVTNDPNGTLKKSGIVEYIKAYLNISQKPPTFLQGALPQILEKMDGDLFSKYVNILKETSEILFNRIEEIPCLSCPRKPEGSMFMMVKLDVSLLEDIDDDMDFCFKLAKEESVIILPGVNVGLKNWLRLCFAVDPSCLEVGLGRLKSFCHTHTHAKLH